MSSLHLKAAKKLEAIGGVFGWLWMLGTPIGLVWIAGALFGDWSWLKGLGILFGAQFCKALTRSYTQAAQQEIQRGLAAGSLYIDESNIAREVA